MFRWASVCSLLYGLGWAQQDLAPGLVGTYRDDQRSVQLVVMRGSVAEPLFDLTDGKFGPYAGQMCVAEWTYPRIHRVDLEPVDGEY